MTADLFARVLHAARRNWLFVALVVFFAALSVQYTFKALEHRSAFERWSSQILVMDGVDIWGRFAYPNPPIMAVLLEPIVKLPDHPIPVGALCWFYLKVGMTLLAIYWVFRLVESPGQTFPQWAQALTVLLSIRPIVSDLFHGNVNLLILFLVIACLYAYHRRCDLTSGVALALGIACKVTPALFVAYFIWKRAGKVLAGCGIGLVLFLVLLPGWRLGMSRNLQDLGSWVKAMVVPYVVGGEVTTEHNNQSLPGLAFRLLTHSPSFIAFDHDQAVPLRYDNLASLDPGIVRWLIKGCMALFAGAVVWTCRTPTKSRQGWRLAAEFSLVILGMLLFSERTWKHHCVVLLLPFAVISYYVAVCRPGRLMRGCLIVTLAASVVLMASTTTGILGASGPEHSHLPADGQFAIGTGKLAQVYGAFVWMYLILFVALVSMLRGKSEPAVAVTRPIASREPAAQAFPVAVS